MHRHALALLAPLVLFGVAACGGDDAGSVTPTTRVSQTSVVTPATQPVAPTAGDAAFLTTDDGRVPAITADGRVFVRAPGAQGFAALPVSQPVGALVTAQLTEQGLADVKARAESLGLLRPPPDYGDPGITDQGYFTLTLTTEAGTFVHHVYAPGETTGDADADAARDRLADFADFIDSLPAELGDGIGPWQPYVPQQWLVDTDAYVATSAARQWAFDEPPVDGCVAFDSDGDGDSVSGVYTYMAPDADRALVVEVQPALPFTDC
jgi:hypothetical protein